MGLAAPRKRAKLSHDPNNTKWTRDTGGFGHKIMTAQGWQPGGILGAKNASHADFHTAANASYIRVTVKDDNLGLGAQRGSGLAEGECTGLDAFQSLLGRLNGKDEDELLKEQKSRADLKRAIYTERRWGSVRFVKGGLLIGDKIQELVEQEEFRIQQLAQRSSSGANGVLGHDSSQTPEKPASKFLPAKYKKTNKKRRKVEIENDESAEAVFAKNSKPGPTSTSASAQDSPQNILPTKPKKSKKKGKEPVEAAEESRALDPNEQSEGRQSKKKMKKKPNESPEPKQLVESNATADHASTFLSASTSGSEKQVSNPQSLLGGRHAVRSRNIAQKRLAVLDTASLNQIFMIKQ